MCELLFAIAAMLMIFRMIDVLGKPAAILGFISLGFIVLIAPVPVIGTLTAVGIIALWVIAAFIIGIRRFMF